MNRFKVTGRRGALVLSASVLTLAAGCTSAIGGSQSGQGGSPAAQTISFVALGAQTVGAEVTLSATASSGLAVSFESDTPSICTESGSTATMIASGTCTLEAVQAGNSQYQEADAVQDVSVNGKLQSITFTNPGTQTIGTAVPALTATASSGLPVSLATQTASVCSVSGASVKLLAIGTCSIQATQTGNSTYAGAAAVTQSFAVQGEPQTITFAAIPSQTISATSTLTLPTPTATSGLPVTLTSMSTDTCSVNGTTVTLLATGTCSIQATQAGDTIWAAATPISQSFTIQGGSEAQTITFNNPGSQTLGTPLTLVATASSALTVTFASQTSSVCTVSGTTATFVTTGTCTIQATQAGNSQYAAATPVSQSFPVDASSGSDPTSGVLPSYNDTYANWKNAGLALIGGIPDRTTICSTVNPLGGGQDDFANIQSAINDCPAGEVVQLGAGAFTVHLADLPINISTGITLRGTGACSGSSSPYCQTSITVIDGALAYTGGMCGTSTSNEVACPNGGQPEVLMAPVLPDYNYSWETCGNVGANLGTGCGATPLAADAAQGQTTIQVTSTSGFTVGSWVLIDEASGAGWVADPMNQWTGNGSVWAASDWLSPSGSPATGRVLWSKAEDNSWDFGSTEYPYQANSTGCWYSYCDRPTAELHKIASIGAGPCPGTNCTLTFDDPLTIAFRQSEGHNAQVYARLYGNNSGIGSPIAILQQAGVENISLLRAPEGGLEMELCVNCWVKNTEVGDWYGGGISMSYSARSELNTVYVHHCWDSVNNGGEYPLSLDSASTEMLITNSITNFAGKGMVARAGGAGSVVSYNYIDDTMYDAESGIGDYWLDMGINASHYSGPHHVLFEGNWGDNLDNDNTHGNSMYITFFRNLGSGFRTPFTDPSVGGLVDDFTGNGYYCPSGLASCVQQTPGPLRAAGPMGYNYWFAYVGNVLGTAGKSTAANGWTYIGDFTASRIFMLGWSGGNGGQDPYLDGKSGSYILINGNYDYLDDAVTWQGSPVALPNSFYLPSEPAFFTAGGGYPWPWVTPTGSEQIQNGPAGCGGTCSGLPAQARWQAGTPFVQP
jgi:hypothetical protein